MIPLPKLEVKGGFQLFNLWKLIKSINFNIEFFFNSEVKQSVLAIFRFGNGIFPYKAFFFHFVFKCKFYLNNDGYQPVK